MDDVEETAAPYSPTSTYPALTIQGLPNDGRGDPNSAQIS